MSEPKAKRWTDNEKVGFLFQIIAKMGGKIPWNDLELPEGRTLKAVQVMVDQEKTKIRKAKEAEANGGQAPATPASGKKRGAKAANGDEGSAQKKIKTPRKKKQTAQKDSDDDEEAMFKSESADNGLLN